MKTTKHSVSAGKPSHRNRISRQLAAAAITIGAVFAIATPAQAGDRGDRIAGTLVGAGIGAIIGDHIGGHDGAKVGGLIGATFGLAATSHSSHRSRNTSHGHTQYYGHADRHQPAVEYRARGGHKHKVRKFNRGYRRGLNDGKAAFYGLTVSYSEQVEYDLSHRHPRYVKGYRAGFRDGHAQARKLERRRIRHSRRHGHGHGHERRYYPNNSYGNVGHVKKPIHREYRKPRHHHQQRHGHGFSKRPHVSLHDRP